MAAAWSTPSRPLVSKGECSSRSSASRSNSSPDRGILVETSPTRTSAACRRLGGTAMAAVLERCPSGSYAGAGNRGASAGRLELVGSMRMQLGVPSQHPVRKQLSKPRLRPSVHDQLRDEMEVGSWIHVVSDARGGDGQDVCRALTAEISPGEEPVAPSQNELS